MQKRGRPKKAPVGSKPIESDALPDEEDHGIASEYEPEIPPLVEEPAPPEPQNLFSAGQVKPARYGPLDRFLASSKPLRPPR